MSSLKGNFFPEGEMKVDIWHGDEIGLWPVSMGTAHLSIHLKYADIPALRQAIAELEKHHERTKDDD